MGKLSSKRRSELIERIMDDVHANLGDYQDFVLDCVRDTVNRWDDEDLLRWVDEE